MEQSMGKGGGWTQRRFQELATFKSVDQSTDVDIYLTWGGGNCMEMWREYSSSFKGKWYKFSPVRLENRKI